uniref:Uncharacterized protein ycf35 n=1 Tax=Gastroclonium compressum TaxID=1852973 RepID=A0A173FZT1_GASCM|nr:conserved hypothetical plastid protein [Coeloseira compressa]ANH09527.1 conserved hypothetical plastid protein [Coeloseira compressa]
MSHFSRIKTSIKDIHILNKTLNDLKYEHSNCQQEIIDSNGNTYEVNIAIQNGSNLFGFAWDGQEYNLIADLQLWNYSISINMFMDQILQKYAVNTILKSSLKEGFKSISQKNYHDGSIKLILQKWN